MIAMEQSCPDLKLLLVRLPRPDSLLDPVKPRCLHPVGVIPIQEFTQNPADSLRTQPLSVKNPLNDACPGEDVRLGFAYELYESGFSSE